MVSELLIVDAIERNLARLFMMIFRLADNIIRKELLRKPLMRQQGQTSEDPGQNLRSH